MSDLSHNDAIFVVDTMLVINISFHRTVQGDTWAKISMKKPSAKVRAEVLSAIVEALLIGRQSMLKKSERPYVVRLLCREPYDLDILVMEEPTLLESTGMATHTPSIVALVKISKH